LPPRASSPPSRAAPERLKNSNFARRFGHGEATMKLTLQISLPLVVVLGLGGCSGLTQMQDTIGKFDQGAHSVASAQIGFDRAARAVECKDQFFTKAAAFAAPGATGGIDLHADCSPTVMTDASLQIRQSLMDSITLYADQIQALASADDTKNLASNEQTFASNLNGFAKKQGFTDLGIASDVEAAVMGITGMILDAKKETDIRAAAKAQQSNLKKIVKLLQDENTSLAKGIKSNLGRISALLTKAVAELRAAEQHEYVSAGGTEKDSAKARQPVPATPEVFFALLSAPGILQEANPFTPLGQPGPDDKPLPPNTAGNPADAADQLNKSLDALVTANDALATAGTGGLVAVVNDLVARAKAAQDAQTALSK
jgi:hypothetical protein